MLYVYIFVQGLLPPLAINQLIEGLFVLPHCPQQVNESKVLELTDLISFVGHKAGLLLRTISALIQPRSLQECEEVVGCMGDLLVSTSPDKEMLKQSSDGYVIRQNYMPLVEVDCLKCISSMLIPVSAVLPRVIYNMYIIVSNTLFIH